MRYLALATDYDGTLAFRGQVRPATLAALERVRASGRKLLLVTGRELGDLRSVFSGLDLFDRVVAENGATLYRPGTHEEVTLASPPPAAFAEALRRRGVQPLSVGRVVVATRDPHQFDCLEVIRELGLELQVIFNKGAVMVLPSGVNKHSGLARALDELHLSPRNCVGVGDAENDHAMLAACECGVAVGNALPALKERADLVVSGERGEGVEELVETLLRDDLAGVAPRRHRIALGALDGGATGFIEPGSRVLIAGPSGSGKTTVASGLVERLMASGAQCCLIDPEGDYEEYEGVLGLGTSERAPTHEEILTLLEKPDGQVAISLLGVPLEDRPGYFAALLPRLQELHGRTGRPHWLVLDEAHHLLPGDGPSGRLALPRDFMGLVFVTVHPDRLAPAVLESLDAAIAVGQGPEETLRPLGGGSPSPLLPLRDGEVVLWKRGELAALTPLRGEHEHRRHRRKYAAGDVQEKAFVFRGPLGKLRLRAQNLCVFLQLADGLDEETWLFHLRRGDYARWFRDDIKDPGLAEDARAAQESGSDESKGRIRAAIEERYTLPG